jgi:hypothetical protein
MPTYNDKTEDNKGRQIAPVLFNTELDGSGTFYHPQVSAEGVKMDGSRIASSSSPTAVNVAAASTQILAANANRIGCSITNISDTWIYLAKGVAAVAETGDSIAPYGGAYTMDQNNLFRGAIYGIHAGAGNKKVTVSDDSKA